MTTRRTAHHAENDTAPCIHDVMAFAADVNRLPAELPTVFRLACVNPTDAATVCFEAFDEADALEQLDGLLADARHLGIDTADRLIADFIAWQHREDPEPDWDAIRGCPGCGSKFGRTAACTHPDGCGKDL